MEYNIQCFGTCCRYLKFSLAAAPGRNLSSLQALKCASIMFCYACRHNLFESTITARFSCLRCFLQIERSLMGFTSCGVVFATVFQNDHRSLVSFEVLRPSGDEAWHVFDPSTVCDVFQVIRFLSKPGWSHNNHGRTRPHKTQREKL